MVVSSLAFFLPSLLPPLSFFFSMSLTRRRKEIIKIRVEISEIETK